MPDRPEVEILGKPGEAISGKAVEETLEKTVKVAIRINRDVNRVVREEEEDWEDAEILKSNRLV